MGSPALYSIFKKMRGYLVSINIKERVLVDAGID